jgi:hypothetical protein
MILSFDARIHHVLATAALLTPAFAGTILSNTHLYTDPRFGWQVQIDVNIFDNYQGDYGQSEWRYTIHNISYDASQWSDYYITWYRGIGGFYLPFGKLPFSIPNPVTPLEGFRWCAGCIFNEFGLSTGPYTGFASLSAAGVGSSFELSLLMRQPVYVTQTMGIIFAFGAQTQGIKYYGNFGMPVQIEAPGIPDPVPEPATTSLIGAGLIALAAIRIRNRTRHR